MFVYFLLHTCLEHNFQGRMSIELLRLETVYSSAVDSGALIMELPIRSIQNMKHGFTSFCARLVSIYFRLLPGFCQHLTDLLLLFAKYFSFLYIYFAQRIKKKCNSSRLMSSCGGKGKGCVQPMFCFGNATS